MGIFDSVRNKADIEVFFFYPPCDCCSFRGKEWNDVMAFLEKVVGFGGARQRFARMRMGRENGGKPKVEVERWSMVS